MAKRHDTPPYEIMRSRGGASGGSTFGEGVVPEAPVREEESIPRPPGRAPWWVGSASPLVLRVPRGIAILSVAGLLLLIAVAYWVGSIRGAAAAEPDPVEPGLGQRTGPNGFFVSPEDDYAGPEVDVPEDALTVERREPGLNYMQLITSTREDCEKLARFFGARGVAIQLVPVHNKELWVAYAVKRGYRSDEMGSESQQRYEQMLRSLGRQWKQTNGGRGTDLLFGELGDDLMLGGNGGDRLEGNLGEDTLDGGSGDDELFGGNGAFADTLTGGTGNDTLFGEQGADTFVFENGFGVDEIRDFALGGGDVIDLAALTNITSFADLDANHLSQGASGAVIADGANTITLFGIDENDLTAGDFDFGV